MSEAPEHSDQRDEASEQAMETWYTYFASQKGSIGYALRIALQGSLTFEAEQRALLGIPPLDHRYDRVWHSTSRPKHKN